MIFFYCKDGNLACVIGQSHPDAYTIGGGSQVVGMPNANINQWYTISFRNIDEPISDVIFNFILFRTTNTSIDYLKQTTSLSYLPGQPLDPPVPLVPRDTGQPTGQRFMGKRCPEYSGPRSSGMQLMPYLCAIYGE